MQQIFTKNEALDYLVKNSVYADEWSGAGMYHALQFVIKQYYDRIFTKKELDKLLNDASNF
jgi:hypothetical protein